MITKFAKLAMLFMVLTTPACDSALSGAPAAPKVNMVGRWSFVDGPITTSYVFRPDGTCTKSVSLPRGFPPQDPHTGVWQLNDDLTLDVRLNDGSTLPYAGEAESLQVTVEGGRSSFASGTQVFVRGR